MAIRDYNKKNTYQFDSKIIRNNQYLLVNLIFLTNILN